MRSTLALLVAVFLIALGVRIGLIWAVPTAYSFDGYQRWAGREHLLVQGWLPATQALIWLVAKVGGGLTAARVALAVAASLGVVSSALVARRLGGAAAGWFVLPLSLFASYLSYTCALYQEGVHVLLLTGALAFALEGRGGRPRLLPLADLLAGALALSRYEGWAFLVLYLAWRRDPRAFLALWGPALWLWLKLGPGVDGYAASPADFSDWNGIVERFQGIRVLGDLWVLAHMGTTTGAFVWLALGLTGCALAAREKRDGAVFVALLALGQWVVSICWMVGLEAANLRMLALPALLAAPAAAAALARGWAAWCNQPLPRAATVLVLVLISARLVSVAHTMARRSVRTVTPEIYLAQQIDRCKRERGADCHWVIDPRKDLGSRERHDGCEVIQGVRDYRHGRDFWCRGWPGEDRAIASHHAVWIEGVGYQVMGP